VPISFSLFNSITKSFERIRVRYLEANIHIPSRPRSFYYRQQIFDGQVNYDNTVVNYGSPAHSHQALSLAILARRRLRFFAETDFGFGL